MIKRLVTISLIIFAALLVIILIVGLLTKSSDGKYGWQKLLDERHALFNSLGIVDSNEQSGFSDATNGQADPNDGGSLTNPNDSNRSQPDGSISAGLGNTSGSSTNSGGSGSGGSPPNPGSSSPATTPKTPSPTPVTNPTPAPVPTPPPAPKCTAGGACTAAEVATHSSAGNCWVIYGSKVYNITAFVNKHPAGPSYFNAQTCGHDITAYLNGSQTTSGGKKHNHSSSAYSILNSYWYASLN